MKTEEPYSVFKEDGKPPHPLPLKMAHGRKNANAILLIIQLTSFIIRG
jgi:hypothetical protein